MSENIKVVCRIRPLNDLEIGNKSKFVLSFPGDGKTCVSIGGKNFNFDHVIQPKCTQSDVYEVVAKPIVADVLNGYNGTIFAYGQTSSGKTFTMEVSYFEIYMDKIQDLLDESKTNLPVHEDKDRVPYVKGATERFVSSPEEVFDVIDEGKANRHVSATLMNERSSRSHSVFMITVRQENLETQKKLHGKLYLVDLAGSEKVAKTGAEGSSLDEAKNINKSLSALGNVINALVEGSSHVPYRDSKLTRILQESLGGNARTTMVICCSPASYNDCETKSTLMFGMRAKTIKNMVTVNEELTADEWRHRYERELEKVKKLNIIINKLQAELNKWHSGESVSQSEWFTENQYRTAIEETKDSMTASTTANATSQPGPLPSSGQLTTGRPANVSASLGAPNAGGAVSAVGDEQLQLIYQQLDEKDDEINKQSQNIVYLRQHMEQQEALIETITKERDTHLAEFTCLHAENQSSKEEVKEVLQALEELAMNYDQKTLEIEAKTKELEEAQEALVQQTRQMHSRESELTQLKDTHVNQKKKYTDIMSSLMKDLTDVGESLNDQLTKPMVGGAERLDEEFTIMRLYISKMRTEAKSLQSRVRQLEEERVQHVQLMGKSDEECKELRVRIQSFEVKMNSLTDKIDESESRKRHLQERVDELNAEVAKLRANEQFISEAAGSHNEQVLAGQSSIKAKLDEEFKRQSELYATQIKDLRSELEAKQKKLEECVDELNNLKFQGEKAKEELALLKSECDEKSHRLDTLEKAQEKADQAKQDLKGLEETVLKELQTLHNLRRLFVQDLNSRIKKSTMRLQSTANTNTATATTTPAAGTDAATGAGPVINAEDFEDDEDDEATLVGSLAQREKILFLETNLDKLTKVHKQLVHDNVELRCELPKLEKRLKSTVERVRSLELSLKEAKEGAMKDRKRYQNEVERIRDVVRQRNVTTRRGQGQIAKPIRAGHAPNSPMAAGGPTAEHKAVIRPNVIST